MKLIDRELLGQLHARAAAAPRRRTHHNLHPTHEDPVQRMCMAMEPGTYIRPHRHPEQWELLLIVSGEMRVLYFDAGGRVTQVTTLKAGGETLGMEHPAGTWHGVATLAPGTVVFECKQGPYRPTQEADFVPWAPPEGHPRAAEFEQWYRTAKVGELPPKL